MVDHRAVGDEGQRAGEVAVEELLGVGAEEAVRPRLCKELHGHRVHLAGLKARPDVVHGDALAVRPRFKGVTGFVRHDLNVVLRAVEVGEDEGNFIVHDARAVAACLLALGGEHVEQLIVEHGLEEFLRLGGELAVELHALGEDLIRRADGAGVAGAELERVVGKAHGIALAEALGLLAVDLVGHGHEILHDCRAELFNVFLRVAVAAHTVVAERGVALVAELTAHRVAQLHELIVELVELCLIVLVPLALGLPCGKTLFIVRAGLERGELGERVDLALKGDLRRGKQLFILLRQLILLLHLGDDLGGEGLEREFCVDEHQIAELLGKFRAERAFEHRLRPRLVVLLQLGEEAVPELFLRVVKGVARVDRVADARKRRGGGDVLGLLLLGEEHLAGLLVALCGLELLGERSEMLLGALGIGTGVGHFRKFHVAASIKFYCVVS